MVTRPGRYIAHKEGRVEFKTFVHPSRTPMVSWGVRGGSQLPLFPSSLSPVNGYIENGLFKDLDVTRGGDTFRLDPSEGVVPQRYAGAEGGWHIFLDAGPAIPQPSWEVAIGEHKFVVQAPSAYWAKKMLGWDMAYSFWKIPEELFEVVPA